MTLTLVSSRRSPRESTGKIHYGHAVMQRIMAPPKPPTLRQRLPFLICIGLLGAVVVVVATAMILLR